MSTGACLFLHGVQNNSLMRSKLKPITVNLLFHTMEMTKLGVLIVHVLLCCVAYTKLNMLLDIN